MQASDSKSLEIGKVPPALLSHGDAVGSLIVFEDARRAIADADTVEQVNKILALATGLAAAARKATDREMEAEAAVLKLEAERKLGQLMAAQKETVGFSKGGRPKTGIPENPVLGKPPTLAEAGIGKNLAAKARKAAAMPEAAFEEAKQAKRDEVLAREPSKPRKRKSRFDAEHCAFILGQQTVSLADDLEDDPEKFGPVVDHLLGNADFISTLVELARRPKISAIIAAVIAKLGDGADHGSGREFEIRFIGAQSEITELRARIAELEGQQAEHIQGEPVDPGAFLDQIGVQGMLAAMSDEFGRQLRARLPASKGESDTPKFKTINLKASCARERASSRR
jgi:hypothetical protein